MILMSVEQSTEQSTEQNSPYLYLYGAMAQPEITHIVRGQCTQEDIAKLDTIITNWRNAIKKFREIESKEIGIADGNHPLDIESNPKLDEIQKDPLFKNTFSQSPIEFKMVETDKLVATQRNVSLQYIDELAKRIPDEPSLDELIDFCLSPKQEVPIAKPLQQAQNMISFSSPSVDFRFLGGYLKNKITEDDLKYTPVGGLPVAVISLFVGYGGGSINVLNANNRLVLNNGFHRVYALRKKGITKIPVVIQNIGNPDLEFPPIILGLTQEYLLKNPRPVLVKDFFVDELTTIFHKRNSVRSVRVQWGLDQSNMAV